MQPSRQRAGFQADALQRQIRPLQNRDKPIRLAHGSNFFHDEARLVHDADGSLFQ
jgi:hypothetical protein